MEHRGETTPTWDKWEGFQGEGQVEALKQMIME
jgi:hypothetical protein